MNNRKSRLSRPDRNICLDRRRRIVALLALLFVGSFLALAARPALAGGYATGVSKLQWRNPSNASTDYQDVTGTLNVLKGTRLIFKAIPNPSDKPWPVNAPTWGGSAGASGTSATVDVTFDTLSQNTSDYKTVTVTLRGCIESIAKRPQVSFRLERSELASGVKWRNLAVWSQKMSRLRST